MLFQFHIVLLLIAVAVTPLSQAAAQEAASVVQPFNFGNLSIRSNSAVYFLSVSRAGVVTKSPQFVLLNGGGYPAPMQISITGFPANTALIVSAADAQLTAPAIAEEFALKNFDIPPTPTTDVAGALNLTIGATIETDGSGNMYPDASYSGTTMVSISY